MIYWYLFIEFLKIGLFTFGGGYGMLPLIKEVVLKYSWLTEEQFFDFIGVCESTPGPVAINMATYIGSMQGGFLGSLIATFAVVLPSFIIILLVASILKKFINNQFFQQALLGIKAVIIGLIFSTGITLLIKLLGFESLTVFNFNFSSLIILLCLFILYTLFYKIKKVKINAIALILTSAGLGIIVCTIFEKFI